MSDIDYKVPEDGINMQRVRKNLVGYDVYTQMECGLCGYDGAMPLLRVDGPKSHWEVRSFGKWCLYFLMYACALLIPFGVFFVLFFFCLDVWHIRKKMDALRTRHTVCPNCENNLQDMKFDTDIDLARD